MRQPSRSPAEASAMQASHSRLVNHVLKSPIEESPPSSLANHASSVSSKCSSVERLPSRMIQDLFNELWMVDAPLKTHYAVEYLDWYVAPRSAPEGHGPLVTICLRLTSPRQSARFDIHADVYSVDNTVKIGNTGYLDPKGIFIQDRIHIYTHQGAE